jgi:hypothetical protein
MKLTCSKCEAESEHDPAGRPKHYEYTCARCGQLLNGDIQWTIGAARAGVASFNEHFVLCRCPQRRPNAAAFFESESYARAKVMRTGLHEKKD